MRHGLYQRNEIRIARMYMTQHDEEVRKQEKL